MCEDIFKHADILHHCTWTYEDGYSVPVCVQRSVKAAAWRLRFVITDGKYRAEELLWADYKSAGTESNSIKGEAKYCSSLCLLEVGHHISWLMFLANV